jgi:hypothetical protein
MATLQDQGVPIQSSLRGPNAGGSARSPQSPPRTTAPRARASRGSGSNRRGVSNVRQYSPVAATEKATGSVGLLEGEFFAAIILLILLMFANTEAAYADKIMSFMKRGFLTCVMFIVLALVGSIGPNASKIAKAFGGLVIVAILITSPVVKGLGLFDNLIKNDWKGTDETGSTTSADSGTGSSTGSAASTAESAASNSASTITDINIPGIGPIFAAGTIANDVRKLLHL